MSVSMPRDLGSDARIKPEAVDLGCGVHVPLRWSPWCIIFRYEREAEASATVRDKTFETTAIGQTFSGSWQIHGSRGVEEIDCCTIVTGIPGRHFGCKHVSNARSRGMVAAFREGALDLDERPLFAREAQQIPRMFDLRRALSIEKADDFDSFVFEVFDRVSRLSSANSRIVRHNTPRMQRAKRFIEWHLDEDISLEVMAGCVSLSPFTFIREFKAATGSTPHRYLSDVRLIRAKALLARPDLKLRDVALRVGLRDRSYFTRWFTKATGMSPSKFRTLL